MFSAMFGSKLAEHLENCSTDLNEVWSGTKNQLIRLDFEMNNTINCSFLKHLTKRIIAGYYIVFFFS